jgi:hypothetical protein
MRKYSTTTKSAASNSQAESSAEYDPGAWSSGVSLNRDTCSNEEFQAVHEVVHPIILDALVAADGDWESFGVSALELEYSLKALDFSSEVIRAGLDMYLAQSLDHLKDEHPLEMHSAELQIAEVIDKFP